MASPSFVESDAVDLRGLPAPEPLLRALAMANDLEVGDDIVVLTPMWPHPLLAELDERGLSYRARALPDGGARILIERPRGGATHA